MAAVDEALAALAADGTLAEISESYFGEDVSQPPKPQRVVMPTRVRPRPLTSRVHSSHSGL